MLLCPCVWELGGSDLNRTPTTEMAEFDPDTPEPADIQISSSHEVDPHVDPHVEGVWDSPRCPRRNHRLARQARLRRTLNGFDPETTMQMQGRVHEWRQYGTPQTLL